MKQEAPAAHRGGPRTATSATLLPAKHHQFWANHWKQWGAKPGAVGR